MRDAAGEAADGLDLAGMAHHRLELAPPLAFLRKLARRHGIVLEDAHGPAHLADLIAALGLLDRDGEIARSQPFHLGLEARQRCADILADPHRGRRRQSEDPGGDRHQGGEARAELALDVVDIDA